MQTLAFIDEHNARVPKIIENWLSNMQKQKVNRRYTQIDPGLYDFQISLKPPGAAPVIPYDLPSSQDL